MSLNNSGASGRFRVLVASRSFGKNSPTAIAALRDAGCELLSSPWDGKPTEYQLIAAMGDVDAVISGTETLSRRVLEAAPRLRVIAKHGVGIENIDVEFARSRGIAVAVAADAISDSVADLAWALMLALARGVIRSHNNVRAGGWERTVGVELGGRTLGVVGLGSIGKAVARRARGFRLEVIATDPVRDNRFADEWGVTYVDRNTLLQRSDFLSLHLSVTHATCNMVDAEFLRRMKRTAFLINTSRGALVDEDALYQALKEGVIAGAAADVMRREPPGASPLLSLENFIATAHLGGQTAEGLRRLGEITAENVIRELHLVPATLER